MLLLLKLPPYRGLSRCGGYAVPYRNLASSLGVASQTSCLVEGITP